MKLSFPKDKEPNKIRSLIMGLSAVHTNQINSGNTEKKLKKKKKDTRSFLDIDI